MHIVKNKSNDQNYFRLLGAVGVFITWLLLFVITDSALFLYNHGLPFLATILYFLDAVFLLGLSWLLCLAALLLDRIAQVR